MTKMLKTVCPRCNGTGFARAFNRQKKYSEDLRKRAEKLWKQGLTLRDIATALELKHPQTVKNLLSYK